MQKTQNIIHSPSLSYAVLSHSLAEQRDDFAAVEFDAFDQAHDHPHVGQHRRCRQARLVQRHPFWPPLVGHRRYLAAGRVGRRSRGSGIRLRLLRGRRRWPALAAGIEKFLLAFSLGRLIVRGAPLLGTLLAMVPPAAERTTQLPPTCVAGMSEEANPAVHAVSDAPLKFGMGLQRPSPAPSDIAGQAAWRDRPDANPRETRKTSRRRRQKSQPLGYNCYVLCTPSSYLIDAKASRGRARFFVRHDQESAKTVGTNDSPPITPQPFSLPSQPRPLPVTFLKPTTRKEGSLLLSK